MASRAALLATLLPAPDGRDARRRLLERMAGQVVETRGGIFRRVREDGAEVARFRDACRRSLESPQDFVVGFHGQSRGRGAYGSDRQSSSGIIRSMNSSNMGTVKAVSP